MKNKTLKENSLYRENLELSELKDLFLYFKLKGLGYKAIKNDINLYDLFVENITY